MVHARAKKRLSHNPGVSGKEKGDFDNEKGILIIHNAVPNLSDDKELCLRSSEQDVEIYVGGSLRCRYDTTAERTFGKNSASKYVFAELHPEDSGKQIDVYLRSTSIYGGRVNNIMLGNQSAIILHEFDAYKYYDLGAIFLIFIGLVGIGQGCIMKFLYHRRPTLIYLGFLGLKTGLWRICESKMRQYYFNSNTSMSILAYTTMSMLPLFILFFMDYAFSKRYRKIYHVMEGIALVMIIAEMVLQVTNKLDYVETMGFTLGLGFVFVLISLGFLVKEFRAGYTQKYRLTAMGIVCFVIFAVAELLMMQFIMPDRVLLAIGILILFILTFVQEMKGLIASSIKESKKAQEKAEELTLQMVIALSATVDAKDRYTNGHSYRVAGYAREIAKRYRMTEKEQESIYYIGMLHDIGKIMMEMIGEDTEYKTREIHEDPA